MLGCGLCPQLIMIFNEQQGQQIQGLTNYKIHVAARFE